MIIAVDTGGTKTLVGCFSKDGKLLRSKKFETPKSVPEYISQVRLNIAELVVSDTDIKIISVALPGTLIDGNIVFAGNLGWRGVNIGQLLGRHYRCPVIVDNDANLAGLSETRSLSKIPPVCLYVTISTGIGTGIITNGSIDPNFTKSEGGQVVLEHDGALMRWEKFASGKAIYATYGKYASEITNKKHWYQIAKNVSRGLLVLAPAIRPDVIIIGGSIGTYFEHYGSIVDDFLKEYLSQSHQPILRKAKRPEEAVLYGCYYNALDHVA